MMKVNGIDKFQECVAYFCRKADALKTIAAKTRKRKMRYRKVIELMMVLPLFVYGQDTNVFDKVKDSLVIITCGNSRGSGFVCTMEGKKWLITNEHVVHSGGRFEARTHSGQKITIGNDDNIEVGGNRDLVRILMKDKSAASLEIEEKSPIVNETLYTYGNSDGGQVMTSLSGACLGVGYDTLEVSIPFVQGNSGGAILNIDGKVVGVVTYATKRNEPDNWVKTGTRFNEVRRFGVRFVDVKWEQTSWSDFSVRAKAITDLNSYVDLLIPLCFKNGKFTLLSELKAKEVGRFAMIQKFTQSIKNIARADEEAYGAYLKIKKLREEIDDIEKKENSGFWGRNGTPESQRKVNARKQKIHHLLGDLNNKWLKVERQRLNALKVGRDFARRSNWKLTRLRGEAKEIADDLQYFIDKFEYYYKNDLQTGN